MTTGSAIDLRSCRPSRSAAGAGGCKVRARWRCRPGSPSAKAQARRPPPGTAVLRVGPDHPLKTLAAAAAQAKAGQTIEVQAGEYPADVALWNARRPDAARRRRPGADAGQWRARAGQGHLRHHRQADDDRGLRLHRRARAGSQRRRHPAGARLADAARLPLPGQRERPAGRQRPGDRAAHRVLRLRRHRAGRGPHAQLLCRRDRPADGDRELLPSWRVGPPAEDARGGEPHLLQPADRRDRPRELRAGVPQRRRWRW